MTDVVLSGDDESGIGASLAAAGGTITRVEAPASRSQLVAAGLADADLFVLTDPVVPTSIPIATELHPAVRIVVYSGESVAEFARAQAGHIVDPALLGPATMAEELLQ
jgi:hypothetical protein